MKYGHGVDNLIHYLDDFFTVAPADSDLCSYYMSTLLAVCEVLGVPINFQKREGPTTRIPFLGIKLDSVSMTASLPPGKSQELLSGLAEFSKRRKCTKRQLLSLIGKLSFACKVVPVGHIFLRRLIDQSTTVRSLHHHLRLTEEVRRDITWWQDSLPTWSGVSLFLEDHWSSNHDMALYTDASGTVEYGAYWDGRWLQQRWPQAMQGKSIAWKELYAILVAALAWGPQ